MRSWVHPEDGLLLVGLLVTFMALATGTGYGAVTVATMGSLLAGIAMGVRLSRWL